MHLLYAPPVSCLVPQWNRRTKPVIVCRASISMLTAIVMIQICGSNHSCSSTVRKGCCRYSGARAEADFDNFRRFTFGHWLRGGETDWLSWSVGDSVRSWLHRIPLYVPLVQLCFNRTNVIISVISEICVWIKNIFTLRLKIKEDLKFFAQKISVRKKTDSQRNFLCLWN